MNPELIIKHEILHFVIGLFNLFLFNTYNDTKTKARIYLSRTFEAMEFLLLFFKHKKSNKLHDLI